MTALILVAALVGLVILFELLVLFANKPIHIPQKMYDHLPTICVGIGCIGIMHPSPWMVILGGLSIIYGSSVILVRDK